MGIIRHIVLFIVTNFEILVYIENMCLIIHIVLFIVINLEILVYIEDMCLIIHIVLLKKVKTN